MIEKIKMWFKPLDEIKLSEVAFAVALAFAINLGLGFLGLSTIGILVAALAVVADVIIAALTKDFKRIISKALAYLFVVLTAAGVASFGLVTGNFTFIAILVFSFTEIVGTIRKTLKI